MLAPREREHFSAMTENEGRALARTACVLLVAATVRWAGAARAVPPVVPADSAQALAGLLDESRRERDEAARRREPLAEGERIDPNRASEVDLDRLPGVGPGTARAIVAAREQRGQFGEAAELLEVPGIGTATMERMRPHLDLPGAGAARSEAPPRASSRRAAGRGAASAGGSGAPRTPTRASSPVSLNSASAAQLNDLPGIGPALAERILAERQERGGFARLEDLLVVRGIGPATLERLRPLLTVP
jgi:competence protein ComEA